MRFKTWPVAALGLGSLLLLIVVSMVASSRKVEGIYAELDRLNTYHSDVDAKLRRLRSDVNLSGIFVRDYLLDVERERAPEYRQQLTVFSYSNGSAGGCKHDRLHVRGLRGVTQQSRSFDMDLVHLLRIFALTRNFAGQVINLCDAFDRLLNIFFVRD